MNLFFIKEIKPCGEERWWLSPSVKSRMEEACKTMGSTICNHEVKHFATTRRKNL